ncbi:beta-N-acetylhexosaminidase [Sulfuriroseicoccus oceanibius]|uniref:beta-N-acetylhexosaminidase n=1 Tax=Sulfuriroseicoccus oceanibius TaxID=2707525 RepID=A0A6B3LFR2_9BACT|nr:beta-N-acetylhexosaminidase [Sulfuriroseicoccus oceanibius]QQL44770.1 beta-N-acetylhexosaminidase [Sulfuriroseicoccus oceanibius]
MMQHLLTTLLTPLLLICFAFAGQAADISILPRPAKVEKAEGTFTLDRSTQLVSPHEAPNLASFLRQRIGGSTGFELPSAKQAGGNMIVLEIDEGLTGPADSYEMTVTSEQIRIAGNTEAGVFYGIQSLLQLLPAEIFSDEEVQADWQVPAVRISDSPRFAVRGMMLDSGRQFHTVEFIKQFIDELASMKMNTFHWHLTELDGWRIEIKKYPKLSEIGANLKGRGFKQQQGFYTQDEIREIVRYAAERYVTIIPEIDIPGHAYAALASYPELLACNGAVPGEDEVSYPNRFREIMCAGKPSTYKFCTDVLTEVMALFPSRRIHIGGDEAFKGRWEKCADCNHALKQGGHGSFHHLQVDLSNRIADFLGQSNRQAVIWSDVYEPEGTQLHSNIAVSWWRALQAGDKVFQKAVNNGVEVICSPNTYTYLNFPVTPWRGYKSDRTFDLKTAYEENTIDPAVAKVPADKHALVQGVIGAVWTDDGLLQEMVFQRLYPRVYAIAEIAWHGGEKEPFESFHSKVKAQYPRLELRGIQYGPAMKE